MTSSAFRPTTVKAWRERFGDEGLKGLGGVRPGRGRKPSIGQERIAEIVHATLHEKPLAETRRRIPKPTPKRKGVSPATVQRIWSARGIQFRPQRHAPTTAPAA